MIQADELKIGNLAYDQAQGIHITPECLKRLGFIEKGFVVSGADSPEWRQLDLRRNDLWLTYSDEALYLLSMHGKFTLSHIKFVHQIQNLYFALTGEELEVNL